MSNQNKAVETINQYFKAVFIASGLEWHEANEEEIKVAIMEIVKS